MADRTSINPHTSSVSQAAAAMVPAKTKRRPPPRQKSADQNGHDHQKALVSRGRAVESTETTKSSPAPETTTGQISDENQQYRAGAGCAIAPTQPKRVARTPKNSVGHQATESRRGPANGEGRAKRIAKSKKDAPDPYPSLQGARPAEIATQSNGWSPGAEDGGQTGGEDHTKCAPAGEPGQEGPETHSRDARFADPPVQRLVEKWRMRQDMVRAMTRLTNQAKAICRRFTDGDKTAAGKLYDAIANGKDHPLGHRAAPAILPLLAALEPLVQNRAAYEAHVEGFAKDLPIAYMVEEIKGLGYLSLGAIVGEAGDLSAYEKGVAGVWKRLGLAVIDGERQRKCRDAEMAEAHGYNPRRRAMVWNVADPLFRAQSRGVADGAEPGEFRAIYDRRKAEKLAAGWTKGHAHAHAKRLMSKELVKRLVLAWRRERAIEAPDTIPSAPAPEKIAAE